jgi:parallel beta-helix repeat protein
MFTTAVGARNVTFSGGTLLGTRSENGWQILLRIDQAHDVQVEGVVFDGAGTDNVWIGGDTEPSSNVRLVRCTFRNARRNAVGVTYLRKGLVHGSLFEGTRGSGSPEAGIDFEPNLGESVDDVVVTENTFRDNAGPGLYAQAGQGSPGTGYVIARNLFDGNGRSAITFSRISRSTIGHNLIRNHVTRTSPSIWVGGRSSDVEVYGNRLQGNINGIYIQVSDRVTVARNAITGYPGDLEAQQLSQSFGIRVQGAPPLTADDVTIRDNDLMNVQYIGVYAGSTSRTTIDANRLVGAGEDGISIRECSDCSILANNVTGSSRHRLNVFNDIVVENGSHRARIYGNRVIGETTRRALWIQPGAREAIVWDNLFGPPERSEYPPDALVMP